MLSIHKSIYIETNIFGSVTYAANFLESILSGSKTIIIFAEKMHRETYSMSVFGDGKNIQFLVQSFTPASFTCLKLQVLSIGNHKEKIEVK